MHLTIAKLIKNIANGKSCDNGKKNYCSVCILKLAEQIKKKMIQEQFIHFVLPAFPAKSANRNKTLSELPDLGEALALNRLQTLMDAIKQCYAPGARLTICSDGYVFNDIVGVSDENVAHYKQKLVAMCQDASLNDIYFFDLLDAYNTNSLDELRSQLLEDYADDINHIKYLVKNNLVEQNLFNGLHRFLYDDFTYLWNDKTKSQIRKKTHLKTYQTIQRSHAWSNLVKKFFPDAIRLSIHPYSCASSKLSFQLLPSQNKWATPWHNVVVKYQHGFELMKKKEAIQLGAKFISGDSIQQHFVME